MNLRHLVVIPASNFMPVLSRGSALRRLMLLLPAALFLFALPRTANAASVEVELPGVSVEVDEESQEVDVSLPGLSVEVAPAETQLTKEGEVIDLSGAWKFSEDLEEKGHLTGWQGPEFDDSAWGAIHVPSFWEKEGIRTPNPKWRGYQPNDAYNGYGWYRRHCVIPADWADAAVMLHFGAIDDWDWTYVNGELVGTTTGDETWDDPREYAIPIGVLKPGEDNVIAVRVCDMGGSGGISESPVELVNTSVPPAAGEAPAADTRVYLRTRSDVVRFGGDVTVQYNEKVSGNVVVLGGNANIEGRVTGDVVAIGGTIHARSGSRIDGDIVAVGGNLDRADGAVIGGDVVEAGPGISWPLGSFAPKGLFDLPWPSSVSYLTLTLFAWGFIALLGVLIMKDRLAVMADALPAHPARAALYGLIGFALTPAVVLTAAVASILASVLLAITLVGIPLIPAVLAALLALIVAGALLVVAGVVAVWLSIGNATFALFGRRDIRPIWAVFIGLVLIAIASHIPVLGHLVAVTVIIFGLGLAIMTGLGANPQWAHRRLGFKIAKTVPEPVPNVPPAVPNVPETVPPEAAEPGDSAGHAAQEPEEDPAQEPEEETQPEP